MPTVNEFITLLGVKLKPGSKSEMAGMELGIKKIIGSMNNLVSTIKAAIPVFGIMQTMDFVQGFSRAANEMRNLGVQMQLPISRMEAISRAFQGAGLNAESMIYKIQNLRFALTDSWGYGTEAAYHWGINGSDSKSDDEIADQIAARPKR